MDFPFKFELVNERTGSILSEGEDSSAKFTVVILEGSSAAVEEAAITGNWSKVKPRDGKPPLLVGKPPQFLIWTLKKGKGRLDNLRFTNNSSFVRSKSFRLGLKVLAGSNIQGAVTNAIHVKAAHGKSNVKKQFPAEDDNLDILVNIAKSGSRLHELSMLQIYTVKELLSSYEKDPQVLRKALACQRRTSMQQLKMQRSVDERNQQQRNKLYLVMV